MVCKQARARVLTYKPTTDEANNEMPYFVTLDRSAAQNFWVKAKKQHLEHPGFPVLQVIKMPRVGTICTRL